MQDETDTQKKRLTPKELSHLDAAIDNVEEMLGSTPTEKSSLPDIGEHDKEGKENPYKYSRQWIGGFGIGLPPDVGQLISLVGTMGEQIDSLNRLILIEKRKQKFSFRVVKGIAGLKTKILENYDKAKSGIESKITTYTEAVERDDASIDKLKILLSKLEEIKDIYDKILD